MSIHKTSKWHLGIGLLYILFIIQIMVLWLLSLILCKRAKLQMHWNSELIEVHALLVISISIHNNQAVHGAVISLYLSNNTGVNKYFKEQ